MKRNYLFAIIIASFGIACAEPVAAFHEKPKANNSVEKASWPIFGHDLQRSFKNKLSKLWPGNIALLNLQPAWFFSNADLFSTPAIVSHGVVYISGCRTLYAPMHAPGHYG